MLVRMHEEIIPLGRSRLSLKDNIIKNLREIDMEVVD
jgi:hypothetical protein